MGNFVQVLLSVLFFSPFFFSQPISWQQLSGPHGGNIYSIVSDNLGVIYVNTIGNSGPFKSTDGGNSWFSIMNGLTPGDNGGFHPLNINSNGDLFIGGAHNAGYLCRSTDGGNSWVYLNNLNPGSSIICIAFDANDNVYVGTGVGIYYSTDNGDNWAQYGMIGSQVEAVAFNDSGHVFAGTSYAVYRSTDGGSSWTQLPTGGGTRTVSVAPNGYIFAGCWEGGGILRSTDNGNSWTYCYPQTISVYGTSKIFFDENDYTYVPTWGNGILFSTDFGDNWTELNDGLGSKYTRAITKITSFLYVGGNYGIYKMNVIYAYWYSVGLPIAGVKKILINSNDNIFAGVWGVNRSMDRGQSWQTINNGIVNFDIRALAVKDNGYLFAGTNDSQDGTVFRSTDNGENWVRVDNFPTGITINGLAVGPNDEIIATATGYHYLCQKSTDDGTTWQDISYGQNIGWGKVEFNSSGDLFMASYGAGLWKLPADDTIWVDLTSNIGSNWINTFFIGSNDYLYTEQNRSTDNGQTWTSIGNGSYIYSFAENSIGHLFLGTNSNGSGVYRSINYGETLELINNGLPANIDINTLAVDSEDYLYAGTGGKSIFKTTTSTVVSVEDLEFKPTSFSLYHNYPNPFNPATKIKYSVPQKSQVEIKVFDVLGNEIATLINEEKPAGNYEINFNASELPSGVYFYQLRAGEFVETRKMMLLK